MRRDPVVEEQSLSRVQAVALGDAQEDHVVVLVVLRTDHRVVRVEEKLVTQTELRDHPQPSSAQYIPLLHVLQSRVNADENLEVIDWVNK